MNYLLSAISGLLLMLCFPEYNLSWLIWLALVPLFIALANTRSRKSSAIYGLLTGIIFFGGTLNWIKIVGLWVGTLYGVLAWIALTIFQAFFIALFATAFRVFSDIITQRSTYGQKQGYALMLLAPTLWMVIEWVRAAGPFGVTAGDLVYSQYTFLHLIQIASVIGSFGITFLIVLVNQVLASLLNTFLVRDPSGPISKRTRMVMLMVTVVLMSISFLYGHIALSSQAEKDNMSKQIKIAVFQPNIPQEQKLEPLNFPGMKNMFVTEAKQFTRTEKPDLVVWPETIVPELLLRDRSFIFRLKEATRSYILLGTPTLFGRDIYNSLVLINPQGREVGFYHKRHLAPFGEYLPFRRILLPFLAGTNFFSNDYTSGASEQDLYTPWGRIAAGICFESILPGSIRSQVRNNAAFIVVITNDAWFKQTAALEQHLSMSVLRAIENRKALIQSANTGYSALIASTGRILQRSRIEKQQWISDTIPLRNDVSIYSRAGDILVYLGIAIIMLLLISTVQYWYGVLQERRKDRIRTELHEDRGL